MKIKNLKLGTFIEQKINSRKIYLKFSGCYDGFGNFWETDKYGEILNKDSYIYYSCEENIEQLNFTILNTPKTNLFDIIKKILKI